MISRARHLALAAAGIFLLPAVAATVWATAEMFAEMANRPAGEEGPLWMGIGAGLWIFCWFVLPRPVRVYVLGHELTHILWTWLFGGSASRLRVTPRGGQVRVTRSNAWVVLAPYFVPLYSLAVVLLYGLLDILFDATPYRNAALALVGLGWAFHITFTASMLADRQPDLQEYGRFFSLSVIVFFNIAIAAMALAVVSDIGVPWWLVRWCRALARIGRLVVDAAGF